MRCSDCMEGWMFDTDKMSLVTAEGEEMKLPEKGTRPMKINDTTVALPEDGQYVLAHFPDQPWSAAGADNNEHKWVVVKFSRGISIAERESLPSSDQRKRMYISADEDGNNTKPYHWKSFGACSFFGQEATLWCELPKP